jgi:hypothetical protein
MRAPKKKMTKKTVAIATAGVLGLATAGGAYAYWTTTGTGTGTASTATGAVTLSYTTAALNAMYPGDSSQTLTVTVKNTSTQKGYVAGVKAYITTNKSECTGADYLLNGQSTAVDSASALPLAWTAVDLTAGGSQNAAGTIQFNNTGAVQDACQGAIVTLNYASS